MTYNLFFFNIWCKIITLIIENKDSTWDMTSFNYGDVCNLVSFNYVRILWVLLYYNKNIYLLLIRTNFQRLIQNLDSLTAKVLKAKYFKKDDFLSASIGSNSSYVWRSILWGRQVILKGYRWRNGPGGWGWGIF